METRNEWPYPGIPASDKALSIELAPDSSAMVVKTTAFPQGKWSEIVHWIQMLLMFTTFMCSAFILIGLLNFIVFIGTGLQDDKLLRTSLTFGSPALLVLVMYVVYKIAPQRAVYEVGEIPLSFLDPGLDDITPEVINKANSLRGFRKDRLPEALELLEREGAQAFVSAINDIDEDPD
nr:Uncharacterised protein [Streptococcus thermophilus]